MNETDLYKHLYESDPVLRLLVDKLHLTPNSMLVAGLLFGVLDLLIAWRYDLLHSRAGIVGALDDPPYLLTIFLMIPLFLRTYVWMADGICDVFMGMEKNHLIREQDLNTYRANIARLAATYSRRWIVIAMIFTAILQLLIQYGNQNYVPTYNTILTPRLVFFRIPLGMLAIYGATTVMVRLALLGDWHTLMEGIEPQINPLHWDHVGGYSPFTDYIINLLGVFVGIATFFFTKLLFQPIGAGVVFRPVYNLGILGSFVLVLIAGYVVFYHFPTTAARSAMLKAKHHQMETLCHGYLEEQRILLSLLEEESRGFHALPRRAEDSSVQGKTTESPTIDGQIKRLQELDEAKGLIENLPESPISQKALQRLGLSYLSIPLATIFYNVFQFLIGDQGSMDELKQILSEGALSQILLSILRILAAGKI